MSQIALQMGLFLHKLIFPNFQKISNNNKPKNDDKRYKKEGLHPPYL